MYVVFSSLKDIACIYELISAIRTSAKGCCDLFWIADSDCTNKAFALGRYGPSACGPTFPVLGSSLSLCFPEACASLHVPYRVPSPSALQPVKMGSTCRGVTTP